MIRRDVVAIGSTVRDAFFETDLEIAKWAKAPSGKALVVPFGEKFGVEKAHFTLGGNAANASITFARQGLRSAIFTKIGNDVAGEELRRVFKKERVNTKLIETSDLHTAYSVLLLQKGERSILTYHGAMDEFDIHKANLDKLKSKWWYVSLPGESYKTFDRLLSYAKKNNIKVALNPSFKHLTGDGREKLLKHLKDISLLSVNGSEAALITGVGIKDTKKIFQKLDDLVPGIVAVTYGSKGAIISDGNYIYKAGIFKNKKLVDRTGAGDAFGSGFVAGLIRSKEKCVKGNCNPENIEYAIRLASANSTSVVEQMGASEGVLKRKEFDSAKRFKTLRVTKKKVQ